MATGLVWVRMRQAVDYYSQVITLEPGEVYALTPNAADQFLKNGMADLAEAPERAELEAAALRTGRRRG